MRIVLLSKTYVADTAQRQLEVLGQRPDVELTLVTPPQWHMDDGRVWPFRPTYTDGYTWRLVPVAFNGRYHLYVYRGLGRVLRELRPDLVHIDEEPYNPAGYQAQRLGARLGIPTVFVAWQSALRSYPPPYSWIEHFDYTHTAHVIAGNVDVADVLRHKGYSGPLSVFSTHGVDPDVYTPQPRTSRSAGGTVVGYVGRLLFDKGLGVLLEALAQLPDRYRVRFIGNGPDREALQALAAKLGVADRVEWRGAVATGEVPAAMAELDIFVLPSLTRPNWKEQFGRALIEAMACGVPVVGSNSGEIPRVVGDAGIITPEGDAAALAEAIGHLGEHPTRRAEYARRGREQVLAHHTLAHVAERFVAVYHQVLAPSSTAPVADSRKGAGA